MSESVINQESLAKELNISVGTVSKALRDYPDVSVKTRARVVELARKRGYRPYLSNTSPSNIRQQAKLIGVLIQTPASDWAQNEYLMGMSEVSGELNVSQVVHHYTAQTCANVLVPEFQPPALRDGMISGLILVHRWPREIAQQLNAQYPCLSIMHDYTDLGIPYVGVDNCGAIAMLVDKLHALGHRQIAFFGRCKELTWSMSRFAGYCLGAAAHGMELSGGNVFDVDVSLLEDKGIDWGTHVDFDRIKAMIDSGVTGWICSAEWAGYNLCAHLKKKGIRVPRDISVVAFGNDEPDNLGCAPLATVSQNSTLIGETAVRALDDIVSKKKAGCFRIELQCEYVEGGSIGPSRVRH